MRPLLCLLASLTIAPVALAQAPTKTPQQKIYDTYLQAVTQDRELQAAFKGASASEVRMEAAALVSRGLPRLDDAALRRRAEIMANQVLPQLSDLTCARVAKGKMSAPVLTEIQSVVMAQDSATVAFWFEMSRKAALAELHQTPAPLIAQEEINAAYGVLTTGLSPAEYERIQAPWTPGSSNLDAAWAIRTIYKRALTLPEPHKTVMMRAFVGSN